MYTPMITKPGTQAAAGGGTGDVEGPASSTDNAIARYDGTTGKLLQDTANATLSDEGNLSVAPTWNASETTFIGMNVNVTNTASAAASSLADFKVSGASKAKILPDSTLCVQRITQPSLAVSSGVIEFGASGSVLFGRYANGTYKTMGLVNHQSFGLAQGYLAWGANAADCTASIDTYMTRDGAAGSIAINTLSTTASSLRVYNTWTNASNYERATISWGSNLLTIGTEAAGTGTRRSLKITAGTAQILMPDLPTSNPAVAGALWNDAGVLKISAG
jgi:hypothetical protein